MGRIVILLLAAGVLGFFEDPNELEEFPEQKYVPYEEKEENKQDLGREQTADNLEWLNELAKKEKNNAQLFEIEVIPADKTEQDSDEDYEEYEEEDIMLKLSEKDLEIIKAKVLEEIMRDLAENSMIETEKKEENEEEEKEEEKENEEVDNSLAELQILQQVLDYSKLDVNNTHIPIQDLIEDPSSEVSLPLSTEQVKVENLIPESEPSLEDRTYGSSVISSLSVEEEEDLSLEETQSKSPYSLYDQDDQIKSETARVEHQIESSPFYSRGSESEDALEDHELKAQSYIQSDSSTNDELQDPFEEELDTENIQSTSQYSSDSLPKETSQSPFLASPTKPTLSEMRLEQANSEELTLPGSAISSSQEVSATNWGSIFIIAVIFIAFLGLFTMYFLFIKRKKKVRKHSSELRTFNSLTGQNEKYKLLKA